MRQGLFLIVVTLALWGCGSSNHGASSNPTNVAYGQLGNMREFGTVLSVNEGDHAVVNGGQQALTNGAASTGAAAASGLFSGILSPLSGAFSSAGSTINANTASPTIDTENELTYVIKKDNGQQVTITQVPDAGEPIIYAGQRAMIQLNGDYLRVYPTDVEAPLQQHVPGGVR